MSGIAGIVRFDGAPVELGQIEKMTAAMAHRGPDGIHHWRQGSVALGHCMLRTTPESLEETQPLANEDASLVLVLDGRVDNREELRAELLKRGAALRTRTDAELVLRAYEAWGDGCPDKIIGEYAFFVWDTRQRRLFAARDAAGTRHFYYHTGGRFAFASEIKGLLALDTIEPRLNDERVLDYLVPEFDRDDVVGTFYEGILRLPAGHAMAVTDRGVRTWRWWNPGELAESRFASLDECAEAFLDQMRVAVKCRLRSNGPVGAMLSGGLDSSSIVGLIRKEFRDELGEPLRTFSLVREDRENCTDWEHIQRMVEGGGIAPTVIGSESIDDLYAACLDGMRSADEPFAFSHGLTYFATYQAAGRQGCSVVLDGIAGDQLFYGPDASLAAALRSGKAGHLPGVLAARRRHGVDPTFGALARAGLAAIAPETAKSAYRLIRERVAPPDPELRLLHPELAKRIIERRRARAAQVRSPRSDPARHAAHFTGGLLSFAHEVYGDIAFTLGVEPRSPFSDRRMIEFAIRMPLEAKLCAPWYKPLLRTCTAGVLPESIRWRNDMGNHPGWRFYERLSSRMAKSTQTMWAQVNSAEKLSKWIDAPKLRMDVESHADSPAYGTRYRLLSFAILNEWLTARRDALRG